jgi:ribonuclease HII
MRVLGIDEAGRGCVLGDLFIAGFCADDPDDEALRAAGANDSKKLARARRDRARAGLLALGEVVVARVTPAEIDAGKLNHLEEQAIVQLVRRFRPDHVYLDALGAPATLPALIARLQRALPSDLQPAWTVEPKADSTYAVVGAASIFAKTDRDDALQALDPDGQLGSGYPSDPTTRRWLAAHAATGAPWPAFVRTRWGTIQDLAQKSLL